MQFERPNALMDEFTSDDGHIPVLKDAVISGLNAQEKAGWYVDATFGAGGHSKAILEANERNNIYAIDQDADAIARSVSFKAHFKNRFEILKSNFENLDQLPDLGFVGMLFDFGVSSYHFDQADRGFSFRHDGPMDMRMDRDRGRTAAEFLETASERDLARAIRDYGEEARWRKVVQAIVHHRGTGKLSRTESFAEIIRSVVRLPFGKRGIDPATKSFQGIRIAVNDELGVIERALPKAFELLVPGGRLAVISFHSLEDRIVKRYFRELAGRPVNRHDNRPAQERDCFARLITTKPLTATEAELADNPRSRSAKLRIIEKI